MGTPAARQAASAARPQPLGLGVQADHDRAHRAQRGGHLLVGAHRPRQLQEQGGREIGLREIAEAHAAMGEGLADAGAAAQVTPEAADRGRGPPHLAHDGPVDVAVACTYGPSSGWTRVHSRTRSVTPRRRKAARGPTARTNGRRCASAADRGNEAVEVVLVPRGARRPPRCARARTRRGTGRARSARPAVVRRAAGEPRLDRGGQHLRGVPPALPQDGPRAARARPAARPVVEDARGRCRCAPAAAGPRSESPRASTSSGLSRSSRRWTVSITRTRRGEGVEWWRYSSANHHRDTPFQSASSRKLFPSTSGRRPHSFVQRDRRLVDGVRAVGAEDLAHRSEGDPGRPQPALAGLVPRHDDVVSRRSGGGRGRVAAEEEPLHGASCSSRAASAWTASAVTRRRHSGPSARWHSAGGRRMRLHGAHHREARTTTWRAPGAPVPPEK